MAAWKHDYCGSVYNGGKNPPDGCGFCIAGKEPEIRGWTRISTSDVDGAFVVPRPERKRAAGAIGPTQRTRIYERDGWICVDCGTAENLTIDHRVPRSRGGGNEDENLQTMCETCNVRKGDAMPREPSVVIDDLHPRVRALLVS